MKNKNSKATVCGMAPASQRKSLKVPATTKGHKNPEMKPIGTKAQRGTK